MRKFLILATAFLITAPAFAVDPLPFREFFLQSPSYMNGPVSELIMRLKNKKKVKFPVTLELTPDCAPGIDCPPQKIRLKKRKKTLAFKTIGCEEADSSYQKKYFATVTDASGKKASKSVVLKCFSR